MCSYLHQFPPAERDFLASLYADGATTVHFEQLLNILIDAQGAPLLIKAREAAVQLSLVLGASSSGRQLLLATCMPRVECIARTAYARRSF